MDLLPPIAAGDLARTSMAEVLAAAFCARATGTITLELPRGDTRLFARYGIPVGVEEPGGPRPFGEALVAAGTIGRELHERALEASGGAYRRYGEVLVQEGAFRPEDLRRYLADHHQALLVRLCEEREGRYELRGWERPPDWTEGVSLDPLRIVVDALQLPVLEERRRRVLAMLGDAPLRRSIDADELLQMLRPGPLERRVVVTLNVPRRAAELGSGLLDPAGAEAFACALALLGVLEPTAAPSAPPPAPARPVVAEEESLEAFPRPVARPMPRPVITNPPPVRPAPPPALSPQENAALDAALFADVRPPTGPVRPTTGPVRADPRPPTGPVRTDPRPPTGPVRTEPRPPTGPVRVEAPRPDPFAEKPKARRGADDEFDFDGAGTEEPLELDFRRAPKELLREPPRPPPPRPPRPPEPRTGPPSSPGNVVVMGLDTDPGKAVRPAAPPKKPAGPEYNPFTFQLQKAKPRPLSDTNPLLRPPPPAQPAPDDDSDIFPTLERRPPHAAADDLDARLSLAMDEIASPPPRPPPARSRVEPALPRPAPPPADDILADIADAVGDLPEEGTTPISLQYEALADTHTPPPDDVDLALMAASEEAREESDRIVPDLPPPPDEELPDVSFDALTPQARPLPDEIDIPIETTAPPPRGTPGPGVVLFDDIRDVTPPPPPEPPPEPTPEPAAPEHTPSRDDVRRRMLQRALRNVGSPIFQREEGTHRPEEGAESLPTGQKVEKLDAELQKEIKARLARPPTDHFARLDLERTATSDDAKEAFLQLAKRFHPDRIVAAGQLELLPQVRELFSQIKESYDVLVDPASRARHITELEGKEKTKRTAEDAKLAFQKAQVLLRRKDLKHAEAELVLACDADPKAEYLAELAWTLLSNPARRDEAHDQIRDLAAKAVKATPPSDRAFVVAGYVARADSEHDKAEKYFRKALELNPRNVDAGREVRLLDLRKQSGSKSMLDKLRGR